MNLLRVIAAIGLAALNYARPKIPSVTLQRALNLQVLSDTKARIAVPHYWALYLHDGRGPFGPRRSKFLVYFISPLLDPRTPGGVLPERASQVRRLTRDEFYFWLGQNRLALLRGETPPMIVVGWPPGSPVPSGPRTVGPARGSFFFENGSGGGMQGFREQANAVAAPMVRQLIREELKGVLNIKERLRVSI